MTEPLIRAAHVEDARAIAEVQIAAWAAAYAGLIEETGGGPLDLDEAEMTWRDRIPRVRADGFRTWVAEDAGAIVGYAFTQPTEDDDLNPLEIAELASLYVHPDRQGQGVGKALLERAVAGMRSQGFLQATLWVIDDNHRAIDFYRREGWRPDGKRSACYRVLDAPSQRMRAPL